VAEAEPGAQPGRLARWWARLVAWWRSSPEFDRLTAAIDEFETSLGKVASVEPRWTASARAHLSKAREALNAGRYRVAWPHVKAARRDLIEGFTSDAILAEAERLHAEAGKKLSNWRGPAVESLLEPILERGAEAKRRAKCESPPSDEAVVDLDAERNRLREARRVFEEHEDNVWWKIEILRRQVGRAGIVLLIALIALIVVVLAFPSVTSRIPLLNDSYAVLVVMGLGALGASLSGVLTPVNEDQTKRIPEIRAQYHVVWVRPLVGAAAAVIVVTVLMSGILGSTVEPRVLAVGALVAGFSERFVGQSVAAASAALGK
jgi:hypothetical protein